MVRVYPRREPAPPSISPELAQLLERSAIVGGVSLDPEPELVREVQPPRPMSVASAGRIAGRITAFSWFFSGVTVTTAAHVLIRLLM